MKILQSRIFKILSVIFITGIICGIIAFFIMKKENRIDIYNTLENYINYINNSNGTFAYNLYKILFSNIKNSIFIIFLGITFIFIIIIPFIMLFKGIMLSFNIISIIYSFKVKGLLYALILLFPSIINSFIYLLLSYYSVNFGFKIYNAYKNSKNINLKQFTKKYIYIYLILNIILVISSLIETYISSNIIKFII